MRARYPRSAAAFGVSDRKSVSSTATKAVTMSGMRTSHSETKRAEFWTLLILSPIKKPSGQTEKSPTRALPKHPPPPPCQPTSRFHVHPVPHQL